MFDTGMIKIFYAPRLRSVYPHYLDLQLFSDKAAVYLLGNGFLGLQELRGSLRCVFGLHLQEETIGAVTTAQSQRAGASEQPSDLVPHLSNN
jgi:hypothetical protein